MPTKIIFDNDCLNVCKELIMAFGKSCLIVTGRSFARKSGALDEAVNVLDELDLEALKPLKPSFTRLLGM